MSTKDRDYSEASLIFPGPVDKLIVSKLGSEILRAASGDMWLQPKMKRDGTIVFKTKTKWTGLSELQVTLVSDNKMSLKVSTSLELLFGKLLLDGLAGCLGAGVFGVDKDDQIVSPPGHFEIGEIRIYGGGFDPLKLARLAQKNNPNHTQPHSDPTPMNDSSKSKKGKSEVFIWGLSSQSEVDALRNPYNEPMFDPGDLEPQEIFSSVLMRSGMSISGKNSEEIFAKVQKDCWHWIEHVQWDRVVEQFLDQKVLEKKQPEPLQIETLLLPFAAMGLAIPEKLLNQATSDQCKKALVLAVQWNNKATAEQCIERMKVIGIPFDRSLASLQKQSMKWMDKRLSLLKVNQHLSKEVSMGKEASGALWESVRIQLAVAREAQKKKPIITDHKGFKSSDNEGHSSEMSARRIASRRM